MQLTEILAADRQHQPNSQRTGALFPTVRNGTGCFRLGGAPIQLNRRRVHPPGDEWKIQLGIHQSRARDSQTYRLGNAANLGASLAALAGVRATFITMPIEE